MTDRKLLPESDEQLSALYQQGAKEQPPEWLDQRILNQANTHIATGATELADQPQPSRWKRWQWPVATAALVVLSSSLVMDLHRQQKLEVELMPFQAEPYQSDSVQSDSVQSEPIQVESIQTDSIQTESIQTDPSQAVPAQEMMRSEQAMPMRKKEKASGSFTQDELKEALPSSINQPAMTGESVASPAAAPTLQRVAPKVLETQAIEGQGMDVQGMSSPAMELDAIEAETSGADFAEPMMELLEESVDQSFEDATGYQEREQKAQQQRLQMKEKRIMSGQEEAVWLARIERLLNEGKEDQAKEELAEFQRTYPEFEIPTHLQRLIEE
jgi:hypothetical protein